MTGACLKMRHPKAKYQQLVIYAKKLWHRNFTQRKTESEAVRHKYASEINALDSFARCPHQMPVVPAGVGASTGAARRLNSLGSRLRLCACQGKLVEICTRLPFSCSSPCRWTCVLQSPDHALQLQGLAAILVQGLGGCKPQQIVQVPPNFIEKLCPQQSLTPSRNNGFLNMFCTMQHKSFEVMRAQE